MFLSGVHGARNVLKGLDAHINDPWDIEDIWLIIVWHYLIKNRRKVYEFSHTRLPGTPDADGSWESSFWRWTVHPMRVVGALWLSLYVFDNAVRVGTLLHMNRWLPDVVIAQFDRGMYTLAAGVMSVMATDHWLPRILEAKANIKDSSQRLVLTRLATVMLAITTVVCSAVVFGLLPVHCSGSAASAVWPSALPRSHRQLHRGVDARGDASVQPRREDLPHDRRGAISWHQRPERRRLPCPGNRVVPDHARTQGYPADDCARTASSSAPTSSTSRDKPRASSCFRFACVSTTWKPSPR